jgi:WD40 repeat protein
MMNQEQRDIDGNVLIAKYSPSGTRIALAGGKGWESGGFVHIYDAQTLVLLSKREHACKVTCLDWSPDGSRLAYGGDEGIVFVWNPATDTLLSYMDHSPELAFLPEIACPKRRAIYAVAWLTDAQQQVTSVGEDGCVRIWDADSGRTAQVTYSDDIQRRFTYAPGGNFAIVPGMSLERQQASYAHAVLFDVKEAHAVYSLLHRMSSASCFAWAPQHIPAVALSTWEQIQIWDVHLVRQILSISAFPYLPSSLYEPSPHSLAWSPDAERLACCVQWSWDRHSSLLSCGRGGKQAVIEIKSATTGATQRAYAVTDPYCIEWSPSGDCLIVGEVNGFELLIVDA